jgi:hypothetical protein
MRSLGFLRRRSAALEDSTNRLALVRLNRAVIVRVSGGLANQMLSYKLGRFLSEMNSASLILDVSPYEKEELGPNRNLQILNYELRFDLAVLSTDAMEALRAGNDITDIKKDSLPLPNPTEKQQRDVIARVQGLRNIYCDLWLALCLRGPADNFAEKSGVLQELTLDPEIGLAERDRQCLKRIEATRNPIAVHVRRGDFATQDGNLLVSRDYYNRSIKYLETQLDDPQFFVFSDDIDWCRENLVTRSPLTFVDWNDERHAFRDMRLASACAHFILSNESTFSHQIVQLSRPQANTIVLTSKPSDFERVL